MGRPPGEDLDPGRLQALAEHLGQTSEAVAHTLHDELLGARAEIDAGLADGDPETIGHGAHAARNSVLMIGAPAVLLELRALEVAATAGDLEAARRARRRVSADLQTLIEALGALGR
jgi:hypothetical protein